MLTIKRNLLVKDLKYFNWMSNLREEFIDLAPEFKDKEVISLCPILEFFLKKKNYYRLADWEIFWDSKLDVFGTFEGFTAAAWNYLQEEEASMFVIKESKLANATSEVRTTEVNTYKDGKAAPPVLSLYAYDHFMQLGGHALLHDIFRLLITSWFAFPSLINDFYKHSLENNHSKEFEVILLKYWIQLPLVINEIYTLLLEYLPEDYFYTLGVDPLLTRETYISSWNVFRFTVKLPVTSETEFYPHTKTVLNVFNLNGKILPKNFNELMLLYKEGLKLWDTDFEYFYKFLELNKNSVQGVNISEATWNLLVYNPPVPSSLLTKVRDSLLKKHDLEHKRLFGFEKIVWE